jgi:sulfite reductase (NADPH) flavoprotein alpha-component
MLMTAPAATDAWSAAPFDAHLAADARQLIERLDGPQRLWLSGYLAGSLTAAASRISPQQRRERAPALVLFGSQSGNAERVARDVANGLTQAGVPAVAMDMLDCRKAELAAAETLLIVVSTQGEGDPPDRAMSLWELLSGRKAPQLGHVRYAVLGLGDSSYTKFCETGKQFDRRLQELGATRIHERADCDVDFEEAAQSWTRSVAEKLSAERASVSIVATEPSAPVRPAVSNAYTRKNPFQAEVLVNQRLTARGSSKDVRHIELTLEGSHIHYEPGDSIGVVARNSSAAVEELLQALPFQPDSPVSLGAAETSLRVALADGLDIGPIGPSFLQKYATATRAILPEDESRQRHIANGDLVELVREFPPAQLDAAAFAALLRPLAPRLYSIASSLHASPDEAHLTVAVTKYDARGTQREGVASGLLASLTEDGATVPLYLHRNAGFRLPAPDAPIIMIGPGTGVAPFRAFVAERAALGARGRNWLFFGDRSFETDFLYQAEWLAWRKQGVLSRLEIAFSRDQAEKVYVQHRMRQCGAELWSWLQNGAYMYVCGDAASMAPDVHAALVEIITQHGGFSTEQADEYIADLRRDRRYQRDVY